MQKRTATAAAGTLIWYDVEYTGEKARGPYMGSLPDGEYFGICTMKCYTYDGLDYRNVGITPNITARPTEEDRLRGFDRVLDTGLKALRERI